MREGDFPRWKPRTKPSRLRARRGALLPTSSSVILVVMVGFSLMIIFVMLLVLRWRHLHLALVHEPPHQNSLIHIVHTRFMQEQGSLTTLARARLELFATFCLPTMIHQTSRNFVWIIQTDPLLNVSIRDQFVQLLKPYPHFFLIGSNINFQSGDHNTVGSWRDGNEGQSYLQSPIYTGDISLLKQAHDERQSAPIVLETRLDADDGLHIEFMEHVQHLAMQQWNENPDLRWYYWCARRHLEWYGDTPATATAALSQSEGLLQPVQHSKLCITPGITVGFAIGTDITVPQYAHDLLYKTLVNNKHDCGTTTMMNAADNDNFCIQMMDDLSFVAIRSRTPTSAGMKDINGRHIHPDNYAPQPPLWVELEEKFAISKTKVQETNDFVQRRVTQIAMDNLKGQCTSGHSCKLSSLEQLQRMLEVETESMGGIDIRSVMEYK